MPNSPKKTDVEAMLNAKAWKDPSFKQKLLKDPKSALKEVGVDLPNTTKVRVVEEERDTLTFILHSAPRNASQMNETQLKKVAGGGCTIPSACTGTH